MSTAVKLDVREPDKKIDSGKMSKQEEFLSKDGKYDQGLLKRSFSYNSNNRYKKVI